MDADVDTAKQCLHLKRGGLNLKLKKKKGNGLSTLENRYGWGFITPSTILITILVFIPMIQAFITSLQSGLANNLRFVGIENYIRLLSDQTFLKAAGNTFLYLIIQVPIMIILSLIIAATLNDKKLKFKGFFRIAIFLPCITSLVAYSIIMKSLFANDGIMNQLLLNLNLI